MATKKDKKVSSKEFWCSVHGRFGGFQWGGHRRKCKAPEGKPNTPPIKAPQSQDNASADASKGTPTDAFIKSIRSHFASLDERIAQIKGEIEKATQKVISSEKELSTLTKEREKLLLSLKNIS